MTLTTLQAFAQRQGHHLSELESLDLGRIDPKSENARSTLESFVALAESGSLFAMCTCAACFRTGWGTETTADAAHTWAARAASHNYPPGQFELALCYEQAVGVGRDIHAAVRLHEKACNGGYAAAALHLAMLYHLGDIVPADDNKAASYAAAAIDLGDVYAAFELASWYEDGEGMSRDPARAAYWYEFAAQRGSVFACTRLANAYSKGDLGLQVDRKRAEEFARLAESSELP
jgi:uncharacterized protein